MSMNIDDLITAYNNGYWSCYEGQQRAGIRAIVEALRDELLRKEGPDTHNLSERIGLRVAVKMFNDILGGAGDTNSREGMMTRTVEAAGASTREDDGDNAGFSSRLTSDVVITPAGDPSPEVCEWSVSRDPDGEGHYETRCGNGWMMAVSPPPARDGYNFCPSCGKPIAFKEVP